MATQLMDSVQTRNHLGCGRTKLHELTKSGALVSVKVGRKRMYLADSVENFIRDAITTQNRQ